ncbi:hypothetical protein D3C87_2050080 [compost metagenome]
MMGRVRPVGPLQRILEFFEVSHGGRLGDVKPQAVRRRHIDGELRPFDVGSRQDLFLRQLQGVVLVE